MSGAQAARKRGRWRRGELRALAGPPRIFHFDRAIYRGEFLRQDATRALFLPASYGRLTPDDDPLCSLVFRKFYIIEIRGLLQTLLSNERPRLRTGNKITARCDKARNEHIERELPKFLGVEFH